MKISFWSPVHGQTATTTNLSVIATFMSLTYTYKNLLMRNHFTKSTLEQHFLDMDYLNAVNLTDTGVDSLYRQMINQSVDSKMVSNYTTMLLRKRLDLLIGTYATNKDIYNKNFLQTYEELLELTGVNYDFTLIDVNAGIENKLSEKMLFNSNLIIINLNQNKHVLDNLFNSNTYNQIINDNEIKIMYVIGMYDKYSKKYNIKNICRAYNIPKNKIGVIPYSRKLADYCNDGKVIEFVLNILNSEKNDNSIELVKNINDCITKIFNVLEVDFELKKV